MILVVHWLQPDSNSRRFLMEMGCKIYLNSSEYKISDYNINSEDMKNIKLV